MGKQESFIKRFTDIIFSIITIILTFPFLILIIIAIKLDSKGPVFFVHSRSGYKGKEFKMIKFRGMVENALAIGPELTREKDPRITKIGKFLRRTSIDEIPQVINVLKGEMSIIGPRPEVPSITAKYSEKQKQIFDYVPGITGISQINGRQTLTPEARVEMECEYYNSETFLSDMKILFRTIPIVISNKGNI